MHYTRTDLCPNCGKRLNLEIDNRHWDIIMVDYPIIMEYKGIYYTTIYCNNCRGLFTKKEVLDFWITTYKENFNEGISE